MLGRIGLSVAVLALIGWAAHAAPIPGSVQILGSWIVQAENDASGKFAYCDATRDGGGALVHIGQSASGSWQIGFTNTIWQFTVGQDVTVTLFIDRVPYPLVLRTLSATTFSTPLPDTTLVDALRQGNMLSLQLGTVYTTFPLDGSAAAINATASCQQSYAASAAPPPAVPAAPAATPSPGGMPPEVAKEVSNLQGNCQVMNKTPPPIGNYVTRIGLTGSGIDDWLINTGGIACAGLSGGGGSMVEIFIGLPEGHARKVFARYALGVEVRGSTVWLGSSGDQCRGSTAAPPATAKTCQVPLVWNKAAQRFDEGSPTNTQ
jgi:hypothetical protein